MYEIFFNQFNSALISLCLLCVLLAAALYEKKGSLRNLFNNVLSC